MRESIQKVDPTSKVEEFGKDELIKELEVKIKVLTEELNVLKSTSNVKNPEEKIIETEIQRLYHTTVDQTIPLDKDDLKKFETLVKCLVSLKNGEQPKNSKKKKVESPEQLLKRVMSA